MLYNYQVNNNIEKIIILGEYNEYSHNKNAKIKLITKCNNDNCNFRCRPGCGRING